MMQYSVKPEEGKELTTAVRRATLSTGDLSSWLTETYSRIYANLADHGNHPIGAPFARYHRIATGRYDVEAGFPVSSPAEFGGDVHSSALPGGLVATTVHTGRFQDVGPAYRAVNSWITEHDGQGCGDPWEVYLSSPQLMTDPASWQTEVHQPNEQRTSI